MSGRKKKGKSGKSGGLEEIEIPAPLDDKEAEQITGIAMTPSDEDALHHACSLRDVVAVVRNLVPVRKCRFHEHCGTDCSASEAKRCGDYVSLLSA